jgi:hypothetical protein
MTTKAIYDVVVQIYPPNEETGYPGQVCEGKFTHEDGVVTLVDHNGNPVKQYTKKINPDESPVVAARRPASSSTLRVAAGKNLKGFDGPIAYRPLPKWM